MIVLLNGRFVPEEQALVSVFDRSFLYGDGLFETLRVLNGQPFRWGAHLERLRRGAEFLGIALPFDAATLRRFVQGLVERNQMPDALLRLTLSRGIGVRGYSPKGADRPTLVMSLHPAPAFDPQCPPRWRLVTASFRLPANEPLAQFKTCNKLPQILARAQADAAQADEALLLNTDGVVVEAASSNLFWVEDQTVCTAPLASGILAGVTREIVLAISRKLGYAAREASLPPEQLVQTDGVFLSLSSLGIVEAASLDGKPLRRAALVTALRTAYQELLQRETAPSEKRF